MVPKYDIKFCSQQNFHMALNFLVTFVYMYNVNLKTCMDIFGPSICFSHYQNYFSQANILKSSDMKILPKNILFLKTSFSKK